MKWAASRIGGFTPGKSPRKLLDRRLGGPQKQAWPLWGTIAARTPVVQLVAHCCFDIIIGKGRDEMRGGKIAVNTCFYNAHYKMILTDAVGRGSAVGIESGYGLDVRVPVR
jgi:hypothetical protein